VVKSYICLGLGRTCSSTCLNDIEQPDSLACPPSKAEDRKVDDRDRIRHLGSRFASDQEEQTLENVVNGRRLKYNYRSHIQKVLHHAECSIRYIITMNKTGYNQCARCFWTNVRSEWTSMSRWGR
jgi:predicted methyltransferase MtxX (methanogen marker protein 4)